MPRIPLSLTDQLYAGVLENPPWASFLEALEDHLPCHSATLVLRRPRCGDPGILISPRAASAEGFRLLRERLFDHSPFLDLPEARVCILHEMLSAADRPRYARYLKFLRTYDTADLIGLDLVDPVSGLRLRLRGARKPGEPPFGNRERKSLEALLPRLQTASAIYGRLMSQQNRLSVYDESSGQLALGMMLLNEQRELLIKNAVADRLLEERDGLCIEAGALRCLDGASENALRAAVDQLLAGKRGDRLLKIRRRNDAHWSLLLRPAGDNIARGDNAAGAIIAFIRDASRKAEVSSGMLVELFGLTRAEARLAATLVQGHSLDEAAAAAGVSRYTARAQLGAIFAKTGTHRQPQLVSLLLNTVTAIWN